MQGNGWVSGGRWFLRRTAAIAAIIWLAGCVGGPTGSVSQMSAVCPVSSYPVCDAHMAARAGAVSLSNCRCVI